MMRRGDVRAGVKAGLVWLAVSAVLIVVGRASGDGWGSLIGGLLLPVGLLGAPGQLAVNWGSFEKPLAPINGFVAGFLAGLAGVATILIIGIPFGTWLATQDHPAPAMAAALTAPVVLVAYTLALVCWVITIFTSVTLAVVEAPAAEFQFPEAPTEV
jgi:hypothetical protein